MKTIFIRLKKTVQRFIADEMTVYASQASFFIVLTVFPIIMLILTMLQMTPLLSKIDLVNMLTDILPYTLQDLIISIVNDLYTKSPNTVLSITGVLALWSAARSMMSIEHALNKIWNNIEPRNYIIRRLLGMVYTLVFIIISIMSVFVLVLGRAIQNFINSKFIFLEHIAETIINFRTLLSIAILIILFIILYTYIPKKKLTMISQLPGAIFSTVGWISFSFLFSIYFNHFSSFSYMYGSLTGVVLLMLWLYICICIVFAGAEINFELSEYTNKD